MVGVLRTVPNALVLMAVLAFPASGAEFHVSPRGDADATGDRAAPFATLEEARDAVRALKADAGVLSETVTVWVHGGDYHLQAPFQLTAEDSGTAEYPVLYRAWPGETVRLSGARPVREWRPVKEAPYLDRLPEAARAHVRMADLRAQGIDELGQLEVRGTLTLNKVGPDHVFPSVELFQESRPLTLTRWPNEDWSRIDQLYPPERGPYKEKKDLPKEERIGFTVYDDGSGRLARWAEEPDPWFHGYFRQHWHDWYLPPAAIHPASRLIDFGLVKDYPCQGMIRGRRFIALNMLSELDSPGEYWIDRETGRVLLWPVADPEAAPPEVSVATNLITLRDAAHVLIRGLTLENTRGTAVVIEEGSHNTIALCIIRNTGHCGVQIIKGEGHRILGCDIVDVGYHGVSASGGDHATLTHARHLVENCRITRTGRLQPAFCSGVWFEGVGLYARHNTIHDVPSLALASAGMGNWTGQDILYEYNEMSNCTYENWDSAYISGNFAVIRYNFFHHLYAGDGWTRMIYIDTDIGNNFIYGNVFYRAIGGQAIHIGGSRYNTVENNIFVDCTPALWLDCRHGAVWDSGIRKFNYQEPPWSVRYPHLVDAAEEHPLGQGGCPWHTRIGRNICMGPWDEHVDPVSRRITVWHDNHTTEEDPGFVDADALDFQLTEDAQVSLYDAFGFNRIPFEKIGCYEDEYRATWPVPSREKPDMFGPDPVAVPPADRAIVVDGDPSDWAGILPAPSRYQAAGGSFRLCWRPEGLYGLVEARDGDLQIQPGIPWGSPIAGPGDCVLVLVEPDAAQRLAMSEECLGFAVNIRPDLGVFGGEAQITYWEKGDPEVSAQQPTAAWIGEDDGGLVAAWKPMPAGYLYKPENEGYVMEYFVPAERLAPAEWKAGTEIGFSTLLIDNKEPVEDLYNPEHPQSRIEIPQTWGRIRLAKN